MLMQPATLNFLSLIDFTSTDCIEKVLTSYYEIEQLALSGHHSAMELYLEIKQCMTYISSNELDALLKSIQLSDENGIREGASWFSEILKKR